MEEAVRRGRYRPAALALIVPDRKPERADETQGGMLRRLEG